MVHVSYLESTRAKARLTPSQTAVQFYTGNLANFAPGLTDQPEGASRADGRVLGSYLHGMFSFRTFRRTFLADLGAAPGTDNCETDVDATLDLLADRLQAHVDCAASLELAGQGV